jgi:hypothetical protein
MNVIASFKLVNNKLPNHVPLVIDPLEIARYKAYLIEQGYTWTFLQIVKPKQLWGIVKKCQRNGRLIEHHVRAFTNGTVQSEYEQCRVEDMWEHLTTVSYSAHERVMGHFEELKIDYKLDQKLREKYNKEADATFPKRYMEFIEWLFAGVIFWTPLGYIWHFYYNMKNKFRKRFSKSSELNQEIVLNTGD